MNEQRAALQYPSADAATTVKVERRVCLLTGQYSVLDFASDRGTRQFGWGVWSGGSYQVSKGTKRRTDAWALLISN
jgi:hypothetical protein